MDYEIIDVNQNNLNQIGLFCHQSKKKGEGYQNKIEWIKERFSEGLKYKILKVKEGNKYAFRGFIEYIPSEYNWRGIKADNFMVIHCLWVIGRHKGKGYASELIQFAIDDAKTLKMDGVVAIAGKKGSWFPRTRIYEKLGFEQVDKINENYLLYSKIFTKSTPHPFFHQFSKDKVQSYGEGVTILYTHQCPYTPDVLKHVEQFAENSDKVFRSRLIQSSQEMSENPLHPYGPFLILCDGVTLSYKPGMRNKKLSDIHPVN